jgi:myo-inositol-1(or 4)-monophosphatase
LPPTPPTGPRRPDGTTLTSSLFLTTAIEAVIRAGDMQMARFGGAMQIDKKGAIDLVTEVDLAVERMFRALIAERFPDHAVLAEEFGGAATVPAGPCWVFDPIDGTTNFAHGVPIFCASLALEIDGVAQTAAVYDPNRRELFTAERGGGARLNGQPLHVSAATQLVDALLVTGFPYDVHRRLDDIVGLFAAFVGRARAVRRLGSAAIDLCWVAAGRMDGFWEGDLNPWDIAGGALIVAEAGGRVTATDGSAFASRGGQVLATNGHLHPAMVDVITSFRMSRPARRPPSPHSETH